MIGCDLNLMACLFKVTLFAFMLFSTAFSASAYIGPGVGLTAFGCLAAVICGFWFVIKGLIYIPFKHWVTKPDRGAGEETGDLAESSSSKTSIRNDK